jgi:hypothetical protein
VDLERRIVAHLKGSSNANLRKALALHGVENFVFSVVEYCDPAVLLTREQYYLDLLFSSLPLKQIKNICRKAQSTLGYHHTEETKAKISGSNNPMFGRSARGANNNHYNKGTAIYRHDQLTGEVTEYSNASRAAEANNLTRGQIIYGVKIHRLLNDRYIFSLFPVLPEIKE